MTSIRTIFVSSCRWAALAASIFLIVRGQAEAGVTINARSVSFADVSSAITLASNGDTVLVPPGTAAWTSTLFIRKNISLIGAGIGQTVITDQVLKSASNPGVIAITMNSGTVLSRLSGFTIQNGTVTNVNSNCITVSGISTVANFRMDHCYLHNVYGRYVYFTDSVWGVVDHCQFDASHWTGCILVRHTSWKGVGSNGDNSWASATNFGTDQAVYIEDCTFDGFSAATALDSDGGGRSVFRYNTVNRSNVGNHGSESSGRIRSGRSYEIYNNTFKAGPSGSQERAFAIYLRGGTALVHNNTFTSVSGTGGYDAMVVFSTYRVWFVASPWGQANATNVWDVNDPTVYASGTASSGGSLTMSKTGAGWTTNQWRGYILRNTITGKASQISTNTSDTITFNGNPMSGGDLAFSNGNNFEIRKVVTILDQPGRGKGDYISGGSLLTNPTPATWPHNALEPIYIWNNTFLGGGNGNGQAQVYSQGILTVQANRDWYLGTPMPGYTPYTYPHPLVSAGTAPVPPSNLRITGP